MTKPGIILVVGDDLLNRVVLSTNLGSTPKGRQALEMLRQQSFDAVLLDLIMPEMDGY